MPRGVRGLAVILAVALVSGAASWLLGTRVMSPEEAAARAQPPEPSPITAAIESRVLRQALILHGTVRSGDAVEVLVEPVAGVARVVVTKPALPVGAEVVAGDWLVEVSGRPVFVLAGEIPMYRDLRPGVMGDDVAALQEALRELGFHSWDPPGRFAAGTEAAVRDFYRSHGYHPVIEKVPTDPAPPARGEATPPPEPPAVQSRSQVVVPVSEVVFTSYLPTVVIGVHTAPGQQPAGPVMSLSTSELTIRAPITRANMAVLEVGDPVVVTPASGDEFDGVVTAIGPAKASGEGGTAGFEVTVEGSEPIEPVLLGQEVRLTAEIASTGEAVLAAPVAAIWSTADGATYVTTPDQDGRDVHIQVTIGLSADGFVELADIDGPLAEGDLLVVGHTGSP